MTKCCVAGFHLFVYSISSIMLNKLPSEICLVSWDIALLRCSRTQAPHISFWVTGAKFNAAVWFQYVIRTCETQTFPRSPEIGVWKTKCIPHTAHTIMKMIPPESPQGNFAACFCFSTVHVFFFFTFLLSLFRCYYLFIFKSEKWRLEVDVDEVAHVMLPWQNKLC